MNIPARWLCALSCALLAAGCGGPIASNRTGGSLPPAVRHGWISTDAGSNAKELLYVADPFNATIDIFSMHRLRYELVGRISDPDGPDGMTTDAAGNLYVTDEGVATEGPAAGDIKVYPKGSTEYARLIVPAKWVPFDAAVGDDGSLYVANIAPIGYFSPGSVSIYPPEASSPSRVLRLKNFQVLGITLHRHTKTIYVSYDAAGSSGGRIAEFRRARGKASTSASPIRSRGASWRMDRTTCSYATVPERSRSTRSPAASSSSRSPFPTARCGSRSTTIDRGST